VSGAYANGQAGSGSARKGGTEKATSGSLGRGNPTPYNEQSTQNWSGQGESDCLIETKHCDGRNRC
jgi:hypothetical protein